MKKIIFILLICINWCSCQEKNKNLNQLKEDVLKGDTISYEKLSSVYFNEKYFELLPFSKIMADKYKYHRAFYDVFEIIYLSKKENQKECVDFDLSCLNENDKNFALDYLYLAIIYEDKTACNIFLDYIINQKNLNHKIVEDINIKTLAIKYRK